MRHAFTDKSMRLPWLHRIVAPLTAATLLASGGAQAILLLGCGPDSGMKSCCCPKGDRATPPPTRVEGSERACCSVTPAPARHEDATPQATAAQTAPTLVAVVAAPLSGSALQTASALRAPDRPRSAGPPILRTTCSLLI